LVMKNSQEVDRIVGVISKSQLEAKVNSFL